MALGELTYMIRFKTKDGRVIEKEVSLGERDLPMQDEIDRDTLQGLRRDLHKVDRAMLETRSAIEKEFLEEFASATEKDKKKEN